MRFSLVHNNMEHSTTIVQDAAVQILTDVEKASQELRVCEANHNEEEGRYCSNSTKGAVKIKCRPRVTQHGGATKTAVEE